MSDSRCILFVGGSVETLPGIRLAKSMGLHVVVSDVNEKAPGILEADASLISSTYDIHASVKAAREYHDKVRPIDGVLCLATDVPLTVASIAAELGLPGIPVESARIVTDKLAMKEFLVARGVPMPWYSPVNNVAELQKIVDERGFPLVIKPVDSRGARGVLRLTAGIDLDWAYSVSQSYSPTSRVMVEEYLDGPQISSESLIVDGVVYTIGFSDRNYEFLDRYAPHIIENGGDLPSFLSNPDQESLCDTVSKAAYCLGIENGVIKGDLVLSEGKPYVIEVALRLSGGYFCTHEIPLNTGVDFVGNAIRLSLGEVINKSELLPKKNRMVCQRYLFPEPGIVEDISIPSWINNDPDIALYEVRVKKGDTITAPVHHPARAGVVIATGMDRNDARERAERAIRETYIKTVIN